VRRGEGRGGKELKGEGGLRDRSGKGGQGRGGGK